MAALDVMWTHQVILSHINLDPGVGRKQALSTLTKSNDKSGAPDLKQAYLQKICIKQIWLV